jgi:hypothetical protein
MQAQARNGVPAFVRPVTARSQLGEIGHCPWLSFAVRVAGRQIFCPKNSLPYRPDAVNCVPYGEADRSQGRAYCPQVFGFAGFQR